MTKRRVFEVDAKDRVVRDFDVKQPAYDAQRLPDGDTLVGGQGFLHRYEAKGERKAWPVVVTFAMVLEHDQASVQVV